MVRKKKFFCQSCRTKHSLATWVQLHEFDPYPAVDEFIIEEDDLQPNLFFSEIGAEIDERRGNNAPKTST